MASFGSFETEREVYSDLVYSVYNARRNDDPSGEYAVKVFRLPDPGLESELAPGAGGRDELERARLSSITVQEQAGAVSRFIAPVLDRGNDSRGLWYATRFYPRSINKMISGKVALPRVSLEHLIRSIAQGALDLKRTCGRSHGDIRPTNIQIGKSEKLTEAEVVLCDPLPGGAEQAVDFELSDLHAIGLILLQLVRQRMMSSEDAAVMLPISAGSEWTRIFGNNASDWLAICNRLLDPNLGSSEFNLDALVYRLEALKPKRTLSPRLVMAGAGGLFLLIALGAWWLWPREQTQTIEVTSNPKGATITVDGSRKGGTTPLELKLHRGDHLIVAQHDQLGLTDESVKYVVQKGPASPIHFQFGYGTVSLRSDPPGATILRNGVRIGRTPVDGQPFGIPIIAPGPVKFQLQLDQYEPAEVTGVVSNLQKLELVVNLRKLEPVKAPTITKVEPTVTKEEPAVTKEEPKTIEPPPPPKSGLIEVRTEPLPALIYDSEGRKLGSASSDAALRVTLAPGQHAFTARAEGLDDVTATLQVQPEATTQYTFVFDYGTVDWITEPASATVLQGEISRATPASFVQKPGVEKRYVIAAPGYRTETNQVSVKRAEHKKMVVKLASQLIGLSLVSDPPGAEFFTEAGAPLAHDSTNALLYYLPAGPANLVARYANLGAITNHVELTPGKPTSPLAFKFDYGTLVLTNLPPDVVVFDGDTRVGTAADKLVLQKAGLHVFGLSASGTRQNVSLNINPGLNFLRWLNAEKTWKNDSGIWFAWVPNLPGGGTWRGQREPGGWVAISETTQGQYKKMDGSNPSFYQEGGDNYPVENLTWQQAMNFCRWLSSNDTADRSGWQYTLPSDQQFSAFAADADQIVRVTNEGRTTGRSTSDSIFNVQQRGIKIPAAANLNGARTHPEPVGSTKHTNQYGLYDVAGNVWEWLRGAPGSENYYGGGSYLNFTAKTIVAKAREKTFEKGPNIGFRMILVPPQ